MISVAEALERVLALGEVMPSEDVPLAEAAGRVLSRPVSARRSQPPFPTSVMDGYAVSGIGPWHLVGDAAAGRGWKGVLSPGQAIRIFTGAPVPEGADRIVIQEDVEREGARIAVGPDADPGPYIRPAGADFAEGEEVASRRLSPADVALLAAMNVAVVPVRRRPVVALIPTGDELVMPGEVPGPDQIVASNAYGLAAMCRDAGAEPRMLPIARDNPEATRFVLGLAEGADLIVTIGGASVGEHDLVRAVTEEAGMQRAFYKVAMRPGKPLMAGRLGEAALLGLPGNPVSAMVCGHVFMLPLIRRMLGLGDVMPPRRRAPLAAALPANGPREHYMRARFEAGGLVAASSQDSALLRVLAEAEALIVRPPHDPAREAGSEVAYLPVS